MAEPFATSLAAARRITTVDRPASVGASMFMVLLFWWAATGLTFGMQWSDYARSASIIATSAFAAVGAWLVVTTRDATTARSARLAFLGAGLIWWWSASIFYAGWGVDTTLRDAAPQRSLALALQAIAATWRADIIGVVALVAIAVVVGGRANRLALWAFATFWGTLQTAKINVFLGVVHSGVELLPSRLAGLGAFFGPARNSALLPVTVLLLAALTAGLARASRRAPDALRRHALAMIALLMGLAALEHALLGVPTALPLWDIFLRAD
ncbi:MAG: DUF3623 family protein [bacterium]